MSCHSRHGKVRKVSAIAATSATSPAAICHTTSITSDSEKSWIAARQSAISNALRNRSVEPFDPEASQSRQEQIIWMAQAAEQASSPKAKPVGEERLSGESERIGKDTWDEATGFGARFGYL